MPRIPWSVIPVFFFLCTGCGSGGGSGGNPITTPIPAPVSLTVSPNPASVGVGGMQNFAAIVNGATNTGVTWRVQEGAAGGAIDASGKYTAPAAIGVYHIIATSQADTGKTVAVPVTVHTLVSITPNGTNLPAGATQTFTATVSGATNTGVTWSVQEGAAGGAVDANGKYTAPAAIGVFHVTATSQADGTQASVAVTVQAGTGSTTGVIQ